MSSSHIILVTGGQRSGKSEMAERLALELSGRPVYLATSAVPEDDADWASRVEAHQKRRGPQWTTVEEPLFPSGRIGELRGRAVLVDCLTLWASNLFFHHHEELDAALGALTGELDILAAACDSLVLVTNEIGLGGISPNWLQRRFTDLQGMVNRAAAARASEVYFMISGLPLKIK